MNPLRLAWWRQAFAIPAPPPWDGDSTAVLQLDWLAQQTVDRGLAVPAIMLLESVRPLQGGASRLLPFFEPLWTPFSHPASPSGGTDWTRLLEHPGAVDWLISQIEQREEARVNAPRASGVNLPSGVSPEPSASIPGPSRASPKSEAAP
jgi:hypothetical protein